MVTSVSNFFFLSYSPAMSSGNG